MTRVLILHCRLYLWMCAKAFVEMDLGQMMNSVMMAMYNQVMVAALFARLKTGGSANQFRVLIQIFAAVKNNIPSKMVNVSFVPQDFINQKMMAVFYAPLNVQTVMALLRMIAYHALMVIFSKTIQLVLVAIRDAQNVHLLTYLPAPNAMKDFSWKKIIVKQYVKLDIMEITVI